MKYIMIVGDGMADEKIEALGGKTPLGYLEMPGMAKVAGGTLGRIRTCPSELAPGSDVAFLSLLGHDPVSCYTGRSPLEAAGEGVRLMPGEVSFRVNLITASPDYENGVMLNYNGGGIAGRDALSLAESLIQDPIFAGLMAGAGMRIKATETFRHIAVMPATDEPFQLTPAHDITGQPLKEHLPAGQKADLLCALQKRAFEVLRVHPVNLAREKAGLLPANGIWIWGAGTAAALTNFTRRYGVSGTAVSAVPLVRGIAWLSGLRAPRLPGATGELDTDYEGKVQCALDALRSGDDFVLLHLEAPDDMSHIGSLEKKLEAIRRLDKRMIQPVLSAMEASGEDFRILLLPDHYTLLSTKTHDGTPVPFAVYDSRKHDAPRVFCEAACAGCEILSNGDSLMKFFLEKEHSR